VFAREPACSPANRRVHPRTYVFTREPACSPAGAIP